jgi:hypothetical protein
VPERDCLAPANQSSSRLPLALETPATAPFFLTRRRPYREASAANHTENRASLGIFLHALMEFGDSIRMGRLNAARLPTVEPWLDRLTTVERRARFHGV